MLLYCVVPAGRTIAAQRKVALRATATERGLLGEQGPRNFKPHYKVLIQIVQTINLFVKLKATNVITFSWKVQ